MAAVACEVCGLVHALNAVPRGSVAECRRCGATLTQYTPSSRQLTMAFVLSALILYVPANVFPVMRIEMHGAFSDATVWGGCKQLWMGGDHVLAVIVFLASMAIPLIKLVSLLSLVISTHWKTRRARRLRTYMYWGVEGIGRWAMLDVFVLAILVSLVKLQSLATILPGEGALAFACVVVFTLLASACFDPRLIWEPEAMRE